jgi:hypothetical protein
MRNLRARKRRMTVHNDEAAGGWTASKEDDGRSLFATTEVA